MPMPRFSCRTQRILVICCQKNFLLNPDNKINMPLYSMKGREVLAGKKVDATKLPAGILSYQEALTKYFPAR